MGDILSGELLSELWYARWLTFPIFGDNLSNTIAEDDDDRQRPMPVTRVRQWWRPVTSDWIDIDLMLLDLEGESKNESHVELEGPFGHIEAC